MLQCQFSAVPARVCVVTSLSPLRGLISFRFLPWLAPWALFLRRFAAGVRSLLRHFFARCPSGIFLIVARTFIFYGLCDSPIRILNLYIYPL